MSESGIRDVAFSGRKIKLTDFLKLAGLSQSGFLNNTKDIVEMGMGMVMVDGDISRPAGLGGVNKRTKLTGGEIVTRFGLTDDPDDPRIIAQDQRRGPHVGDRYRYPTDIVRAVAATSSSAETAAKRPVAGGTVRGKRSGSSVLAPGTIVYLESRRSPRAEREAQAGRPVPKSVYQLGNESGVRSSDLPDWLLADVPGIRQIAVAPGGRTVAIVTCQAPPEPYATGRQRLLRELPGYRVLDGRGASAAGLAFSPDGGTIAYIECCGGADGVLVLLDPATGARRF